MVLTFWTCSLVAPLYFWKHHSNTMVRELQYYGAVPWYKNGTELQYYSIWKCTLLLKFMYHGNTFSMCMVLPLYMSKIPWKLLVMCLEYQ